MNNTEIKKVDNKDLKKVFWRSFTLQGSFNYERMQGLGYAYSMIPVIKKLYKTKEEISAALKRHLEFFNTSPQISTFIMGVTTAMEEQNANNKDFDETSINAVKTALMGPLAGIGDSFFWGTFRIIAAGIGASLTVKGNPIGIFLYILLFNIPHLFFRYFGLFWGYKVGTSYLESISKSGLMQKITTGASIVGLIVVGAMTGSMVTFTTPLVIFAGSAKVQIQTILDQILPSMLPLGLTLLLYYFLKKGVKVNYLLIGIIIFGILGKMIWIL